MAAKRKFETLQVHAGQESPDSATGSRSVPIYQTSSFVFDSCEQAEGRFNLSQGGNIYSRIMNPTSSVFEQRVNELEGGSGALCTASGAAAITYAVLNIASSGDHIVSSSAVYGGTYNLFTHTLKDFGIGVSFVDQNNIENFRSAIQPNTKALFVETLSNPASDVADIDGLALIAKENGIPLIVDNTFATPYLFRPIEHGANVVVHSATKFIGGHGTTIGGIIVDGGNFDWAQNDKFPSLSKPNNSYHGLVFSDVLKNTAYIIKIRVTLLRDTGAALSPFHSFLFLQGLETLSLRVERHVSNTLKVVDFLSKHPQVEKVNHPSLPDSKTHGLYKKYFPNGAGSIFTFEVKGDEKRAKRVIDELELFSLLANVADAKSLVIHPASTTHSQMNAEELRNAGIKPNTIRLSIGIEHIDDILEDLSKALSV